jgi:drug/metabolite transporter (DMT)-like permease
MATSVPLRRPHSSRLAFAALILANVALACGTWLVRIAQTQSQVGPIGSAFWRLTIALPLLLLGRGLVREPQPSRGGPLIVAALVSGIFFAADLGAWHLGILHSRLANATLLGNITAITFPATMFVLTRHMPDRREGAALLLAAIGAMLLVGRSYELSARNFVGDLFCLFAGVCYTGYLVAADRARSALGPVTTLAWSVAAGIPVLLVLALIAGDPLWPKAWWPLIGLALCSQIVGQGLVLFAVSRVSALLVGLMLLLQPIVGAAIGWLAYDERLGLADALGGIAIGAAVLLVRRSEQRLPADQISLSS